MLDMVASLAVHDPRPHMIVQPTWLSRLFGTNSCQHCDNYLTHPTNSPKPHPCYLLTALSLQTENTAPQQILSRCVLFSLPPSSYQLQTPSTIAVCLSTCLTFWI